MNVVLAAFFTYPVLGTALSPTSLAGVPGPKNKKDIFGQNRQFQKCLFSENILNFSQIFPNQILQ